MESGDGNWTHSGTGDTWTLSTARAYSGSYSFYATDVTPGAYDIGALSGAITYEFMVNANPDALRGWSAGMTFKFGSF